MSFTRLPNTTDTMRRAWRVSSLSVVFGGIVNHDTESRQPYVTCRLLSCARIYIIYSIQALRRGEKFSDFGFKFVTNRTDSRNLAKGVRMSDWWFVGVCESTCSTCVCGWIETHLQSPNFGSLTVRDSNTLKLMWGRYKYEGLLPSQIIYLLHVSMNIMGIHE